MELFRRAGLPLPAQHTSDTTPTGPGPAQQETGLGFSRFGWCDLGLLASSFSVVKGTAKTATSWGCSSASAPLKIYLDARGAHRLDREDAERIASGGAERVRSLTATSQASPSPRSARFSGAQVPRRLEGRDGDED